MSDVAREADVARVTVSRVLSDPMTVASETRAAVRAAVARLGYVPNLNAGALASRRSRIVGAIVPTLSNAWFADTMDGLSETLAAQGYQLLLGQSRYGQAEETRLVEAFVGRRVDAIVLTGTDHAPGLVQTLRRAAIPVVECWESNCRPIDILVGFSNEDTGRTVARHLMGRGCRHLGFIGAEEPRSQRRLHGFRDEARKQRREVDVHLVRAPSSVEDGALAVAALMSANPQLDGVFCSNDTLALGALKTCRQHHWDVPGRVAVVGFSDLPVAAATVPSLTTIRIDSRAMGERMGHLLLNRLSGQEAVGHSRVHDLGFELVIRESA